jgi:hypothetical protein
MELRAKKAKLQAIKDEVKELHEILKILIPKLPNIQHVDYTHGTGEMGADFILTKLDPTLNEIEYIGVIAKKGKILQDISDIERQIEECEIERFVENGKKKISLTGIYIINNEAISRNAKEKINYKYSTRNIKFIDGDDLCAYIDKFMPNYWSDIPVVLGEYLAKLWSENELQDKAFNLIEINNQRLYIEPDIFECDAENYSVKAKKARNRKKINIFDEIEKNRITIIEGGIGYGKSKLLRQIVDHYSSVDNFIEHKIIPISISFKSLADDYGGSIINCINNRILDKLSSDDVSELQLLVLVDAIDEKRMEPDEQIQLLTKMIEEINKSDNIKAVFTARYFGYIAKNQVITTKCNRLEIHPLTIEKVVEFLRRLCSEANLSQRLIEDLKKSNLFKSLPKTPIAAILLAKILNTKTKDLPSSLTELFTMYLELVLGRWDIDKGLQSQKEFEAAESIVMKIACYVIDNNLIYLSIEEVKSIFNKYLNERNLEILPGELYEKVIARSGILVLDEMNARIFFKHRSFAEYFYAKEKNIKNGLKIDNDVFNTYWMNVYFFYLGIKRDCPELLLSISQLKPQSEMERWLKMINMGNYMLAGFMSPYSVIEEVFMNTIKQASELFYDITEKRIESILSQFPEVFLVWLFQAIIKDGYGFEYYKRAIDNANLQIIEDIELPENNKIFCLFLIGFVAVELKIAKPFDFLIDSFENELPLNVQLALKYESLNMEDLSKLLNKQNKKLEKAIRDSASVKDFIKSFHERPLSKKKLLT